METGRQGTTLFTAICLLIALLLIIQLWLISAALDAAMSAQARVAVPASVASLVLFAFNVSLLWYVLDFDRRRRRVDPDA